MQGVGRSGWSFTTHCRFSLAYSHMIALLGLTLAGLDEPQHLQRDRPHSLGHPKGFFINPTVVAASYKINFKGTWTRFREHHGAESSEYWGNSLLSG